MMVNGKSRLLFVAILLAMVLSGANIVPALADGGCGCPPCPSACHPVRSPGYWMNHPEAWPDTIQIGGVWYDKDEAIAIMKDPVKGDKTLTMFPALVAATLNHGWLCWCIKDTVREASTWMHDNPPGSGVKANSEAWQYSHGEALYLRLDAYNNGMLCAPAED